MEAELAIVYSPREWANRLARHLTDHGGARVRLRVVEGRVALEERFDVLVAEDVTSWLTPRFMSALAERGAVVLGVYDPDEPTGKERLRELGVHDVLECSAPAEEFVRTVTALRPSWERSRAGVAPVVDDRGAARGGHVTVVGGPVGGVGRTEVVLGLARALATRGERAVVVDGDDVAPAVAQRLGLPLAPNVRTAVDALQHASVPLEAALASVFDGRVEVLAGLPSPTDWPQLRPADARDVVVELSVQRDHVVVDVSGRLEDLSTAGGPDRHGVTRALVGMADTVVAVGTPTPVGVARLLAWIADLQRTAWRGPVVVLLNLAPAGQFRRGELEQEVRRTYPATAVHFLPQDPAVAAGAWSGKLAGDGDWTRAVAGVAGDQLPRVAPAPAVRRRGPFARLPWRSGA